MNNKPNKKIWNKLSKYQKDLWEILNYKFGLAEYWTGIFKVSPTEKEVKILCHNLALVAVWTIGKEDDSKNKRSK